MTLHEIRIPEKWSFGTAGGPGYQTEIITLDSGAEERVSRWNQMRHRFTLEVKVEDFEDLRELREFFIVRRGAAAGFLFRDLHDYASTASGKTAFKFGYLTDEVVLPTDQLIGIGDGATTEFQLVKRYTDGLFERTRKISRPVQGTVRVAFDGVEQLTGWTVDPTTGKVVFSVAPPAGVEITAGYEFDVPVRFGKEIDEVFDVRFDGPESGSIVSIPLIELIDESPTNDEYFFGGSLVLAFDTDIAISTANGVFQVLQPSSAGLKAILPGVTNRPLGQRHFDLKNDSVFGVALHDQADAFLVTIGPGEFATVDLGLVGAVKTWFVK